VTATADEPQRKERWKSGRRTGGNESPTATQKRKSPEVRREPLRKIVPDFRVGASDEDVQRLFTVSEARGIEAELAKRETPLARGMVDDVPADGAWYLAAICFSQGEATALASHIARGGYGGGVSVARGPMPNKNKHTGSREPWCLLLKKVKRGRRS
jgi:hypothetical protein